MAASRVRILIKSLFYFSFLPFILSYIVDYAQNICDDLFILYFIANIIKIRLHCNSHLTTMVRLK